MDVRMQAVSITTYYYESKYAVLSLTLLVVWPSFVQILEYIRGFPQTMTSLEDKCVLTALLLRKTLTAPTYH